MYYLQYNNMYKKHNIYFKSANMCDINEFLNTVFGTMKTYRAKMVLN